MPRLAALLALLPCALLAVTNRPLLPLPGTAAHGVPAASDAQDFLFAVGGDNRATGRGVPMPPTAREIFRELGIIRPVFALWSGDTIYGSEESPGEAEAEYTVFLAAAGTAKVPIFNAPGNHEIHDRPEFEGIYERRMGRLYGSFDYGNSHFIAIDTEEGAKPGIGPEQRAWLEADLAANQGAAHRFVFCHHPLFPTLPSAGFADPANRDDIHRLFVKYRVSCVFSGHQHLYARSVHDGVIYIVSGGGGAPSEGGTENGGFQHYLLVYVNGPDLDIRVIEPWRIFERIGPVAPDGSCTAQVDNYTYNDIDATVDFPTDQLGARASVFALLSYKGWMHPLSAVIEAPRAPGVTTVRVTVPKARTAFVTLRPGPARRTGQSAPKSSGTDSP